MSKKVYAVKKGIKTGIFDTWDEAKPLVNGIPGSEYKSFPSTEKALEYLRLNNTIPASTQIQNMILPEPVIAGKKISGAYSFVEGIFNERGSLYGYGGFLVYKGITYPISGSGNDTEKSSMRNIAGEIEGSLAAAKLAVELGIRRLSLLFYYSGIEAWVTGAWKAKKPETQAYRDSMREIIASGLAIRFINVKDIQGIPGNELADQMAKEAVGLLPMKKEGS